MSFSHIQGSVATGSGVVTSMTLTLGSNPTPGNCVCIGFSTAVAVTLLTVKDSNNNNYTVSSGSPSTFDASAGQSWLAYLLNAPANATSTINLSWTTNSVSPSAWGDEFSYTGTLAFDKDAKATAGPGTTVNTPTIIPSNSGELLYAVAGVAQNVTAPTAGSTLGVWTGAAGGINRGDMAEYDLNSTNTSTAVEFTQAPTGTWSVMVMALKTSSVLAWIDFGETEKPYLEHTEIVSYE